MYILNITRDRGETETYLSTTKSIKTIINKYCVSVNDEVQIYDIEKKLLKDFYIARLKKDRNDNFCLVVRHSDLKEESFKMYWDLKVNKYQYKR